MVAQVDFAAAEAAATPIAGNALNLALVQLDSGGVSLVLGDGTPLTPASFGLAYGTYAPTLFNTTNISASTTFLIQYSKVGNVVTVSGMVTVTPTAIGGIVLGISLPIASAFAGPAYASGTAVVDSLVVTESFAIYADAANSRFIMRGLVSATSARNIHFTATYRII